MSTEEIKAARKARKELEHQNWLAERAHKRNALARLLNRMPLKEVDCNPYNYDEWESGHRAGYNEALEKVKSIIKEFMAELTPPATKE